MAETFKAESISADSIITGGQLIGAAPGTDLYIDPAGDDGNDGLSAMTPVQSWERLFELIPLIISQNTTVHMAAGEYQRLAAPVRIVNSDVTFSILGATEEVFVGSADAWVAGTDQLPFVGSTPGWTPDVLIGCFLVGSTFDPASATYANYTSIYPIMSNTADTLTLAVNKGSALTGPFRILRSLSYVDDSVASTFSAAFIFNGWLGTGYVHLALVQSRYPRQTSIRIYSSTPWFYLIGCSNREKHPSYLALFLNVYDSAYVSCWSCWGVDCQQQVNTRSVAYFQRCWFKTGPISPVNTAILVSSYTRLYLYRGCRFDGYSNYGIQLDAACFLDTISYSTGDALLGTCGTAGIYILGNSSAKVYGGANNTLSGPGAQNVRLGDGTYKAYTDASAAELTQLTRWIKG